MAGHGGEVDVLEIGLYGLELRPGGRLAVHVDDRAAGEELGGDDRVLPLDVRQLALGDHAAPNTSAQLLDGDERLGLEDDLAVVDDRHAAAELGDVLDDVRGENDNRVLAEVAEEVEEAHTLGGVESGGGLVDDDELRIGEEGDSDTETLAHPAGVAAELLLTGVPEVGLVEEGACCLFARSLIGDAFEDGEVVKESFGGDVGVDAEFLGEVAEGFSDVVFLFEDVEVAQSYLAGVGLLERGDRAHEGGLAGAVRAEESVHAGWDRQGDVLEGLDPVAV